jgi:tRNA threonylcarbamoyladenosine biosynthesis protein TsaE
VVLVTPAPRLQLVTLDADQTKAVAAALARLCAPGDVLLLAGDLGAGKTTFAQGFGAGLGIDESITSPTFTLVRQYPVPGPSAVRTLLHADVYRLDHLSEIVDLGLGELVEDAGVALVEWGDRAEPVLGADSLAVHLEVVADDDGHRSVTLAPNGTAWSDRWDAVERAVTRWRSAA